MKKPNNSTDIDLELVSFIAPVKVPTICQGVHINQIKSKDVSALFLSNNMVNIVNKLDQLVIVPYTNVAFMMAK